MKKTYKKLSADLLLIETEGGFMSASVVEKPVDDVRTSGHELNEIDLGSFSSSWNDGEWKN